VADAPDRDDRTEAPTPRRLEKARDEGQVAVSPELAALAALGAAALALALAMPAQIRHLVADLAALLAGAHLLHPGAALRDAVLMAAAAAAIPVLAVLAAAIAAALAQTGLLFHPASLAPDLARLSPMRGLSRMFGLTALAGALKSLAKLGVVGWAAWHAVAGAMPLLEQAPLWSPARLSDGMARLVLQLIAAMLVAQLLIALADLAFVRWQHARSLRMSRQELRDEAKEMEGDPQVKGRLKRLRLERSRRRMLAALPKATVVITNPTHYAVALSYARDGGGAPRLVAKGVDAMAARIREAARAHGVPVVENPPLARALYPMELDREIPEAFYKPVAEIIAYVWRLRGGVA
jgi:flagellar biosynthetic protein FlhB